MDPFLLRYPNPFAPGKRLIRPDLFTGRNPQIVDGVQLLMRAFTGNVRHGMITGDGGIGKSSLSSQIQGLAKGDVEYLELVDWPEGAPTFNFLVAEHIAGEGQDLAEIVLGLLASLDYARNRRAIGIKWTFTIDLKVIRAQFEERATPVESLTRQFVGAVEATWNDAQALIDGVVVVVDELDKVAESPGVSTFLKVATEMLSTRGLDHVMVLIIGTTGVKARLGQEHRSTPRIFESIEVPPLSVDESREVVTRALGPTGVAITDEANLRIASLAQGYPGPIHVIGSEAYEADTDDVIDLDDVEAAVQVVVREKMHEELEHAFLESGSGNGRAILEAVSNHPGRDVPLAEIRNAVGLNEQQVSKAVQRLMNRDVLVRVDRGVYRISDPLFEIYVRTLSTDTRPVQRRPQARQGRDWHRSR